LNRGADVRVRNNYAETAAILAEKNNHIEIVELLMNAEDNRESVLRNEWTTNPE